MATKMRDLINNQSANKTNQRTTAGKAAGEKTANDTVNSFDPLAEKMADGCVEMVAALVDLKVATKFQDGTLQNRIEERIMQRFVGYSESFENNLFQIEGEIDKIDNAFLLTAADEEVTVESSNFQLQSEFN